MSQKYTETINSIIAQLVDLRDNGIASPVIPEKKSYPEPGPKEFWVKIKCKEASRSVSKLKDFKKNHPKAYAAAKKYGWLEELYPLMNRRSHVRKYPQGFMTVKTVTEIANLYKTRSEFRQKDEPAYNYAHRNKFIDTLFPNGSVTLESSSVW
jgi:hypothetical protein